MFVATAFYESGCNFLGNLFLAENLAGRRSNNKKNTLTLRVALKPSSDMI
jgi:hypothetical protein